jgi:uncharacterized membrane protein
MIFFTRNFFTKGEGDTIISCIKEAEKMTSGEIRVHFQKKLKGDVRDAAVDAFFKLEMDKTKDRNGVLFFIVPRKKVFAIIGDEGIDSRVSDDFWDEEKKSLEQYFKKKRWAEGLCKVIVNAGEKLKKFFPIQADDINELPDEITYS